MLQTEVNRMAIYTRKGDYGQTDLIGGRVMKAHPRLHVIGLMDEVMVLLGQLISRCEEKGLDVRNIEYIYRQFFILQTIIADVKGAYGFSITTDVIAKLENWIDSLDKNLPPLRHFIYYTGHEDALLSQLIRVKIRTVERWLVNLGENEAIDPLALAFINRVSDYFYIFGRWLNHHYHYEEKILQLKIETNAE